MLAPILFPMALLAASVPDGWVEVPAPSSAVLECANSSQREWRVSINNGIRIEPEPRPEKDQGPALPFALHIDQPFRGHRRVLPVAGGYLVGSDGGEWGGQLLWVDAKGKEQRQLVDDNVAGLVSLGAKAALALHGLNHMGLLRGTARWLEPGADGAWRVAESKHLDAGPQTFVASGDVVYVLTAVSLTRITSDHKVTVVQPTRTVQLYPNSMARDASGTLWVGMRLFVLRLTPKGERFTEQWFLPKGCEKPRSAGGECQCHGDGTP